MDRRRGPSKRPASSEGEYTQRGLHVAPHRQRPVHRVTHDHKHALMRLFRTFVSCTRYVSAELEYWIHAKGPLQELSKIYNSPSASATIDRVNRLISVWSDSTLPAEGFDGLKNNYQKLTTGLQEIKHAADRETRSAISAFVLCLLQKRQWLMLYSLLSDAVERISVLIAMRRASADIAPQGGLHLPILSTYSITELT